MNLWLCFLKTEGFVHRTLETLTGRTLVRTMQVPANLDPPLTAVPKLDRFVYQHGGFHVDDLVFWTI
jgi:hypothetical protein